MKKGMPYLLGFLLLAAVLLLLLTGNRPETRVPDQRVTLRRHDKIPYGTWVAYRQLPHLFPGVLVSAERNEPGYWDSLSRFDQDQALLIVTSRFQASYNELRKLQSFAQHGNDVFISATELSYEAEKFFSVTSAPAQLLSLEDPAIPADSLRVHILEPGSNAPHRYSYPGKKLNAYFSMFDSSQTQVRGFDDRKRAVFVQMKAGEGNIFLHLAPSVFTNYFLMHRSNLSYYEYALSHLRPDLKKLVWDEYYQLKKQGGRSKEDKNWFSVLMHLPNAEGKKPFRPAFWLLIGLGILYVLLEMRRRQRLIPLVRKPANASLDFVRTVGRLYYEKGDHLNLCRKMSVYFLEHVRQQYKLSTTRLDEAFVRALQYKSGAPEELLRDIMAFIRRLDGVEAVSEKQLLRFHRDLDYFYHHT